MEDLKLPVGLTNQVHCHNSTFMNHLSLWSDLYIDNHSQLFFIYIKPANSDKEIAALLPFTVNNKKILPKYTVKTLKLWGHGDFYSQNRIQKVLISKKYNSQQLHQFIHQVLFDKLKNHWDSFDFHLLEQSNSTLLLFDQTEIKSTAADYKSYSIDKSFVASEEPEKMQCLPKKKRYYIRRGEKQLQQFSPPAEYKLITTYDEDTFNQISELHLSRQETLTQKGLNRSLFFANRQEREALKAVFKKAAHQGVLNIHSLYSKDKLLAVNIMLSNGSESYYYIIAISEALHKTECSRYLLYTAIMAEFSKLSCQTVVHSWGDSLLKKTYSNKEIVLVNGYITNKKATSNIKILTLNTLIRIKQALYRP